MNRSSYWVALSALVLCPMTAPAFGLRPRAMQATAYYYYPAPLIAVPAAPPVYAGPGCAAPLAPGTYAVPVPAPPAGDVPPMPPASGTPPANAPRPAVSESSYSTSYSYYAGPAGNRTSCAVAFWNYSGRDVTLTVEGQQRLLPRGKGVTLDLPRAFTWRIDNHAEETEQVPSHVPGMEIVIGR